MNGNSKEMFVVMFIQKWSSVTDDTHIDDMGDSVLLRKNPDDENLQNRNASRRHCHLLSLFELKERHLGNPDREMARLGRDQHWATLTWINSCSKRHVDLYSYFQQAL